MNCQTLGERAKQFAFAVAGQVFNQIIDTSPGHSVITPLDSGWLDSAEREVKLSAQLKGNWQITDRPTGDHLDDLRQPLTLRISANIS